MKLKLLSGIAISLLLTGLLLSVTGCFSPSTGGTTPTTSSTDAVKPNPKVVNVIRSTSGVEGAYFATLDITVKNDGAEGTILVQGSVTQAGKTSQAEMPVFLKQGQTSELKLTYPLVWKGGDISSSVQTLVP